MFTPKAQCHQRVSGTRGTCDAASQLRWDLPAAGNLQLLLSTAKVCRVPRTAQRFCVNVKRLQNDTNGAVRDRQQAQSRDAVHMQCGMRLSVDFFKCHHFAWCSRSIPNQKSVQSPKGQITRESDVVSLRELRHQNATNKKFSWFSLFSHS